MKVSFLLYSIITLVSSHIVMAYNVYLMLLTLLWPTRTTFESPTTETAAVSPSPVTRMAQVWGVAVWCSRPARATCTSLQCSEDTAATTTRLMPQLLLLQSRLSLLLLLRLHQLWWSWATLRLNRLASFDAATAAASAAALPIQYLQFLLDEDMTTP